MEALKNGVLWYPGGYNLAPKCTSNLLSFFFWMTTIDHHRSLKIKKGLMKMGRDPVLEVRLLMWEPDTARTAQKQVPSHANNDNHSPLNVSIYVYSTRMAIGLLTSSEIAPHEKHHTRRCLTTQENISHSVSKTLPKHFWPHFLATYFDCFTGDTDLMKLSQLQHLNSTH